MYSEIRYPIYWGTKLIRSEQQVFMGHRGGRRGRYEWSTWWRVWAQQHNTLHHCPPPERPSLARSVPVFRVYPHRPWHPLRTDHAHLHWQTCNIDRLYPVKRMEVKASSFTVCQSCRFSCLSWAACTGVWMSTSLNLYLCPAADPSLHVQSVPIHRSFWAPPPPPPPPQASQVQGGGGRINTTATSGKMCRMATTAPPPHRSHPSKTLPRYSERPPWHSGACTCDPMTACGLGPQRA